MFEFSQDANGTGIFDPEDCALNGGTWGNGFIGGGGGPSGNGPSLGTPPNCVQVANPDDFGWGKLVIDCAPSGSSGGPGGVPFNPAASQLSASLSTFAEGPVGKTILNGVNLLGCTSEALIAETPFGLGKYLGPRSPDMVSGKLRIAGKLISPNPDAKIGFLISSNYGLNTERAVNALDKINLPQWSEWAATASSNFAPYAPFASKALGIAGWSYTAYNVTSNTSTCMKNGGPDF